jgi:hypothetical protein
VNSQNECSRMFVIVKEGKSDHVLQNDRVAWTLILSKAVMKETAYNPYATQSTAIQLGE